MKDTKVALITGAARRIGSEIVKALHQKGINIVLHYNTSHQEAEKLCNHFNKIRPNSVITTNADLSAIDSLNSMVDQTIQTFGRLDILINNASRFYKTMMGKVTEYEWDDLLTANLKAPFFLSQAAAPHIAKQRGSIINIADIHSERPLRHYAVYSISKAGIVMLTKVLAKELGPDIRVNAISPGPVLWPEGKNALTEEAKRALIERTVLLREGDPTEIAKAALFFVESADYITGQVLAVDGGRSLFI